jgi:hypothetical protein
MGRLCCKWQRKRHFGSKLYMFRNVRFAELDAVLGALGWVGIRYGHVVAAVEEAGHLPE